MIIKFIKKKFNLIKICAVFTTVCFVVSTLGANLYAIPLAENTNQKYEDVFNKVSSISAEYGKITSSKDANSDITVINIQDLHCHPQTQRNISKIITQIADKYNLKRIYVEGGYGDIDTSWLNTIKDEKIKKQIIEGLLEEGILTGSEYYKLTNNNEVELKGIDEEQIHKDNVRRLSWIIANQDKYKDVITKVENEINMLEKMYVNSRNERFNRDIEKYLTNEIDSRRFYRQLAKYVKDINEHPDKYNNITAIRLEDYPNITKFIALRKTSKDIDVREVTQQLQMVINELKNKLPYNVYTRLLSETENLSDSQKVVELITMLCNKEGINLESRYKALNTFLESNGINRELNTVELVQEERQLLSEIRKALSYNNEEYEITFISDFSKYFKDYLEYKLTDADWKYFEKEFDQFITLYTKYATVNRMEEIYGDFDEINKYYKINDQRNNIFVSNLLKDEETSVLKTDKTRQDEEILKDSKEVIIAVTGGFHSSELEEILAKKEVNTIVITPSIFEGIEKATKQYKGIIKEQSRFFQHQALAYTLASCTTDVYKQKLLYSMAKDILGGNVERLKTVLGENVDLTVFDDLQPLTEQEQEQFSYQKNLFAVAALIIVDLLPKEGGMTILRPNMDNIILGISEKLVDEGIFLSKGPVFGAETLGLPTINGISPEVYSRMHAAIQAALVAQEGWSVQESAREDTIEDINEEIEIEKDILEEEEPEEFIEDEEVDSNYLSEERKSELLKKLNNDKEALDLLIDICCRKSVNFDLSKDSALLEMFIRKLNLGEDYLDFDYMYDIVKRSIHVANTFLIDTDLKFACFEKFIDFFNSKDKNKNGEVYYITLFRRLFSLNKKSLQFFYETLDGLSANDLVFYYDASKINKNLKFLFEKFDKGIYEITDYSRLVNLFDNIDKLNFLSEGEFSYLISLPNKIFVSVLYSSKDSFQLKTKLTVGKKYYYKGCDEDVARAIFDKAEKLQGLNVVFYPAFSRLNKEAILFILDNVNNSLEIEKILSMYRGMGLSPEFENSIRLKDFKDPRFKALVKYISSIQDRDFYDKLFFGIYDRENLRNIVNSIDDADFVKDYLLNPEYQKIYKNLFKKLADLNIKNVAAENNHLALKLILNKEFNQILTESGIDNISDEDNIVARYYSAIAVSRMIFDGVGGEKIDYDFNDEEGMELIKEVTDTYLEIMKEMLNVVLLDSDTKIYALCNSERIYGRDRFNIDTLQEIIEYMGIQLEIPEENVYRRVGNNKNASKGWLNAIETFVMDSIRTKGYFMFRGHGNENMLWVYDPKEKDNGLATGNMFEVITPRELAESLFKLATRDQDPVDLRNITIDLSSCYSYYFARTVYNILEQKFKTENKTESYPTIITAAGLETEFGITDFRGMEGNLHKGINKFLRNFQRGAVPALTLGMVGVSEYMFSDSNITMFSSFFDENMLEKIAKTRESIAEFNKSRQRTVETEPDILDNIEQTATRVNIRNVKKIAIRILPKFVTESSVFRADKAAPLWEEIVYRALPTLALTMLLIASTMFLPAVPVVAVIAKLTCIGIFSLVQIRFIKAHIVTDWLKAMDAGGPVNLKDVFEDSSLTTKQKINKTIEIIKERILVIFPNSKEERSFYRFYTRNKQAISHREGLIIPTIVFSLPYLAAIIFFNSMPVVAIATVISMALHFINNEVARTLEEKEKLKEKQSSVKFLDIQKRLSHVELLIDNPQMKMDLPEIRVGRLALMFGLETINERRAKNLSDYEKVRDSFINRLEPENLQKQKESIEKELSRIEGKKIKTKKDKEKIAELKEKLEIIEKEYPKIRAELLSADTKKVEKIIDSINSLLPIFEEIEGILEEIEFFREVNGDTEETRELEREFLDFTEQTLMRELMSLYDANVTGLHVRRVVAFSKLIGSNMPFGNNVRMMYNLMLSSILHDIGKNLVPGTILNKQGSFDDFERDIMDFHVVFGGFILRSSILKNLSYTAENHHYTTKNSPRSYSFDSKMGYEHEAADYEEAQIAKIVTLTDVYEAVSPKLSFSTERTYQFPRKIRDISDMLENISAEVDLTEFQKKEVIVLLAEIAQIDSEEDAAKKQEIEQAFIKKVLYDRSRNFVINYVREKNYDFVRANAFKVIFTKSPQDLFKELGKTEEEFMDDFEIDPEGTIDKCMSLVSEFEFDTAVVRAFLEFYFSSEDININDEIIESLNKEKESDFIVYMKKLSYSFYKMFRRARFIMVRFAPVIASVFHEEEVGGVFDIKDIINQDIVIETGKGDICRLHIDDKLISSYEILSGIPSRLVTILGKSAWSKYGIENIDIDENGKILRIKFLKDSIVITKNHGQPIGNIKNNLSFSLGQISAMLKDVKILDYDAPDIKEDEMDKYVAHIYLDDADVPLDPDKDGYENALEKAMQEAIDNNKLMIIHVFREGFKTEDLTLSQIFYKYLKAYELLQSDKLKKLPMFSEITQLEKDVEFDETITSDFFLKELLKNHFGHGNYGLFEYPIACYISKDGYNITTYDSVLNLENSEYERPFGKKFQDKKITRSILENFMKASLIQGDGKGRDYMSVSKTRDFEDSRYVGDLKIDDHRFYKATATFKLKTEEQKEAAKQYKKVSASASSVTSASFGDKESETYSFGISDSKTSSSVYEASEQDWKDFWGMQTRDTVSRLYNRGLTKYLRQYLKQTGKSVENLTEEESAAIRQKAENYRFTLPGLAYGAFLEIFALWEPNFIDRHNFDSSTRAGMIAVVWTVRALSIGIGLTTAFLSVSALPVSTILLAAAVPAIFGAVTISSSFIIHLLWNIGAVLTSNEGLLLQTEDEHIKIIADSISLDGNYEVSKHFFRFRPGDLIKFKDSSSIMKDEGNSITISLPNNWKFSKHAANNGLNIQDGKVSIKKEDQLQRFVVIIDENKKEHIFVINQSGYKEVTISLDNNKDVPLEQLKKTTGVDIDEKGAVLPEDKDKIVLKIHDLKFESCFEPFTIEFNGQKNNFIFRNKKLYKISEYGRLEEVNLDENTLLSYGIESFKPDGNKITSFILSKERQFGAAVRQAVGIDEEDMEYRMEQILASGETGVELFLLDDFKEIPSAFVTYFFQVQGLENSLIERILETHGNTISPENLEKSLTNNGFLEEDAKMWVERIFAEYISNFSNIDISEEIPLDFLRYFLEQEESKDILKRQDIIELLSRRGKTISKEDLKNELKKLGFSEEDAQNMADEVELDVYGEKIPTRFLDFYFKDYPLEGVEDIGRTLVLRNPDLTSIAFLRRFLKKEGFSEEYIKNLIEEIKKAFKGEREGEKGKLATAIVQSLLLKDDLIEKLGYKFTKKQAQQIANKCRKKDGNLVSFETLQEVFNEFFGEKATEDLPKIMEYLYSKDEESNSKLYDSDKADNAEGIRISFLRTFFEEEGLSEKDVIVFFFERAKSISIENLERELLGLGYSEQKAKNLIERIRSKYPQKIDKFKFEKIPTDYITSLFNKGFVDRKIILLLESGKAMSKEDLEEEFGKYWSKDRAKDLVEKIFAEYIKDIRRENIHVLSRYQTERILLRAGVKPEHIQINEDGTFPDIIKKDLEEANLQDKELEIDDTVTREKLISLLNYTPVLVSMSIQALSRAFALDKQSAENKDDSITTLGGLIGYLKKKKKDKNDTYLRGYFAEIYLSNKTVAGTINGLKIRLQLPDNTSEPGIDLVDPVKGMKVQVKIDKGGSTKEASSKNPDIPIACTMEVAGNKDKSLIKGFVKMKTIDAFAEEFLSLITDEKLALTGEESDIKLSDITGHEIFAIDELLGIFNRAAILPENMGLVNRIMQSKFGNAFVAATVIAFKEFRASLEPNFVDLHQTAASKRGAQEVASLANRYNIKENDTLVTKIVKSVLGIIFKGASIVKHIAIDYRYIKASGIQEAINMFGKDAKLTEDGQIEVAIVEDIELLQGSFTLVNTGLKVDGASIYRIKNTNLLIYGARGQESIKVVKTLNGSDLLSKDIIEMLRANGENVDEIQAQAMVTKSGDGISVTDDIIEIGEMELAGRSPEQVKQFVASALEIKRVMGLMYGQKTIIDLKSVKDLEKLRATVYNGRARKVISKEQYESLDLTEADIKQLKQNGIEIYIDNSEITDIAEYKNKGVAGQIIRDDKGIRIKDYSTEEEIKIEEILEEQNIESKILTAETPIMIGIDILTKHFKQGSVTAVQREFGALLGKIKMSLNLGELNMNDIEYMGYNINFNRIPTLTQSQIESIFEKIGDNLQIVDKDSLIEIIGSETEFAIILKTIKNKDAEERFKEIAIERILAKSALTENNKEFGLKDKNLEILLGRMLLAQVNNTDKQQTNISDDFRGGINELMEKIKEETEKAMQKDEIAINTIIELILVYGDNYKEKQLVRDMDKNDLRNYRAMMSAA